MASPLDAQALVARDHGEVPGPHDSRIDLEPPYRRRRVLRIRNSSKSVRVAIARIAACIVGVVSIGRSFVP
jgi:hypothetical protein